MTGSRRNMAIGASGLFESQSKTSSPCKSKPNGASNVEWQRVRNLSATVRKVVIDALIANNVYEFRVCARNLDNVMVRHVGVHDSVPQ